MRGKLGFAVEHPKFAGAQRVVGEIEESLRRSPREYPGRAQATAPTSPRPAAPRPVPVPVEPAPSVTEPPVVLAPPAEPEKPTVITAEQPVADAEQTNPSFRPGAGPPASAPDEITERIHVSPLPSPPVPVVSPVTEPGFPPGAPLYATLSRETAPDPRPGASPRDTGGRPLFHVRPDGGLEVASRGVVFVRKGSVVWD